MVAYLAHADNTLPVDPDSAAYLHTIGTANVLHPDLGSASTTALPINGVTSGATLVKTTFDDKDDSDVGPYPVGTNALVEGGSHAGSGSDQLLTVMSAPQRLLHEVYPVTPVTSQAPLGLEANGTIHACKTPWI